MQRDLGGKTSPPNMKNDGNAGSGNAPINSSQSSNVYKEFIKQQQMLSVANFMESIVSNLCILQPMHKQLLLMPESSEHLDSEIEIDLSIIPEAYKQNYIALLQQSCKNPKTVSLSKDGRTMKIDLYTLLNASLTAAGQGDLQFLNLAKKWKEDSVSRQSAKGEIGAYISSAISYAMGIAGLVFMFVKSNLALGVSIIGLALAFRFLIVGTIRKLYDRSKTAGDLKDARALKERYQGVISQIESKQNKLGSTLEKAVAEPSKYYSPSTPTPTPNISSPPAYNLTSVIPPRKPLKGNANGEEGTPVENNKPNLTFSSRANQQHNMSDDLFKKNQANMQTNANDNLNSLPNGSPNLS